MPDDHSVGRPRRTPLSGQAARTGGSRPGRGRDRNVGAELLAGLLELEPWLRQWQADPQLGYAGSPADFFTGLIDTELAALGTDRATLATLATIPGVAETT
jgi:hypothetical protein